MTASVRVTDRLDAPEQIVMGNEKFCEELGFHASREFLSVTAQAAADGKSTMLIGWGQAVKAVFSFVESTRTRDSNDIAALKNQGLDATILTGDRSKRAAVLAKELDVVVAAELLPDEKLNFVRGLQQGGMRHADTSLRPNELRKQSKFVAMVGDGLNDAPALGVADVGIALGCGVEVTRDAADMCLLSSDVGLIPWAIELAQKHDESS